MNRMDNPHFTFDREIDTVLDSWKEQERHAATVLSQLQVSVAPAEAEQRMRHALVRHAAETGGVEEGLWRRVHDQQARQRQVARRLLRPQPPLRARRPAVSFRPAPLSGPDFWWVRTDWTRTDAFDANATPEGWVFTGGPSGQPQHNWLEPAATVTAQFGAVAIFQIPADRLPHSSSGRWSSQPSVMVLGGLLASTGGGDLPGVGSSASCCLHLDHRLFQCLPGPGGPAAQVLGEAHAVDRLVSEVDAGQSLHRPMPGHVDVPRISFDGLDTARALWARLEIRVDVQVQGTGSLLWCCPEVGLVTPQWPLRSSP